MFAHKSPPAFSGPVLLALVLTVVLTFVAVPMTSVQAQSANDVAERLRQIDQVLNDLQRVIYKGEAPPPRSAATLQQAPAPSPAESARSADLEVRLSGLEEQMRSMTGPIETAEHQVNVIGNRLDKLIADIDFRLSAIEQKLSGEQMSAPATADTSAAGTQPATTVVTTVVGDAAAGTQVLGTVPVADANGAGQQTATVTQPAPAAAVKPLGVLPDGTVRARYDFAYGLLRRLKMADAEVALKEFLVAHAEDPLADNARYWLGESYFSRRDYTRAAATFFEAYSKAPTGIKARDNIYKLGKSLARMEQKDDACASFDELLAKFNTPADQTIRQRAMLDRTELGCQ
ncbi:MAG: tetratricopeptide repeat protein [Alphaproteobacteria bacterium]|nr:tetratricopeptide repeat protein [Alphaproteobacteria bacterium]